MNEILTIINNFQLEFKEFILENGIIAKKIGLEINIFQRDVIIDYFQYSLEIIDDNILLSTLLYRDKEIARCLDLNNIKSGWKDCENEYIILYKESKKKEKAELKRNEYFGTYNKDKFYIVKNNFVEDKRNENKGRVCKTWSKPVLIYIYIYIYIMVNVLKMDLIINNRKKWDTLQKTFAKVKEVIIDTILDNKYIKVCTFDENGKENISDYDYDTLYDFETEDLQKMLYYSKLSVNEECELIKEWFKKNNILNYDDNCGTSHKKS